MQFYQVVLNDNSLLDRQIQAQWTEHCANSLKNLERVNTGSLDFLYSEIFVNKGGAEQFAMHQLQCSLKHPAPIAVRFFKSYKIASRKSKEAAAKRFALQHISSLKTKLKNLTRACDVAVEQLAGSFIECRNCRSTISQSVLKIRAAACPVCRLDFKLAPEELETGILRLQRELKEAEKQFAQIHIRCYVLVVGVF